MILLFYKYVTITNPHALMHWQRNLCQELDLKGRIILAHEGINGTLGGNQESIQRYQEHMLSHQPFAGIDFKHAPGDDSCFPKLRVVVKREIVKLGIDPTQLTTLHGGKHLTPQEVHQLITHKPDDLVLLDARNNFESRVGTFTQAITPDISHFRDLPTYIDNNIEQFNNKQVLMFCTGGVRCERASAYLATKKVARAIYQLEGGIHRYIEQFPDGYFRGKNYVFDGRVTVKVTSDILSTCSLCNRLCDAFNNCLNASCNKHFIGCDVCIKHYNNTCSPQCNNLLVTKQVKARPLFKKAAITQKEHDV